MIRARRTTSGPVLTGRLSVRVTQELDDTLADLARTLKATQSELVDMLLHTPSTITTPVPDLTAALAAWRKEGIDA